jgi:hypothetical protein
MSTQDVPGANPANADKLATGCWAEHSDGSLIFVKGTENGTIVYEIYDTAQTPPVYYNDAMREDAFKRQFSFPPVGSSSDKWTWHDKTHFPWDRVMKGITRPVPQPADSADIITAAKRVADSLKLRAQTLQAEDVSHNAETLRSAAKTIMSGIAQALGIDMEKK